MNGIHILGQGAIGSMLAARALQHAIPCTVETKPTTIPVHSVRDLDGSVMSVPSVNTSVTSIPRNTAVLLPLKAYHIESAMAGLAARLAPDCFVVLMNNGMIDHSAMEKYLVDYNVFHATTSHAAKKDGHRVDITGRGRTEFGLVHRAVNDSQTAYQIGALDKVLSVLIPPATFCQDIRVVLWKKLVINAVINPLTALHKVANGALSAPQYQPQIRLLVQQFCAVANASGLGFIATEVEQWVNDVIAGTAKNLSSMHQDIHHGRRTEVEFINGYIVRQGNKKGIDVSAHALLVEQINAMGKTSP